MARSLLRLRWPKLARSNYSSGNAPPERPNQDYFEKEKKLSAFLQEAESEAPAFLRAFATKFSKRLDLYRWDPTKFSPQRFRAWKERNMREAEIVSQMFIEERHSILGNDLATATFIVYRGGKVKFKGRKGWIELDQKTKNCPELPRKFQRNWHLEAVDAAGVDLLYEGLANFVKLPHLRWLSFANNKRVDEWFVDRVTGEFGPSLEYLDLSGCTGLRENALTAFYRCPKLKELVLTGVATTPAFQLGCLFLEDCIPQLKISGVDYIQLNLNK